MEDLEKMIEIWTVGAKGPFPVEEMARWLLGTGIIREVKYSSSYLTSGMGKHEFFLTRVGEEGAQIGQHGVPADVLAGIRYCEPEELPLILADMGSVQSDFSRSAKQLVDILKDLAKYRLENE